MWSPGTVIDSHDLRRLFRGERLSPTRKDKLARCPMLAAMLGGYVVGLAVYEHMNRELWVHEFVIVAGAKVCAGEIAGVLLSGIEIAALASGGERIVLTARAATSGPIVGFRGYCRLDEGCAGRWLQKTL